MTIERCVACGAEAKPRFDVDTGAALPRLHPYVAVIQAADVPANAPDPLHGAENRNGKPYASYPCCELCHRDPRRHAGLKAHFFSRNMARVATNMAGSTDGIGG